MEVKYFYTAIELFGTLFCILAAIYLRISKSVLKNEYRTLASLELTIAGMLFFDSVAWFYRGVMGSFEYWVLVISNFIVFFSNTLIPVFFSEYVILSTKKESEGSKFVYLIWGLSGCSFVLLCFNLVKGFIYTIDRTTNLYSRGNGFAWYSAIYVLQMLICLAYIYIKHAEIEKIRLWVMIGFILLPFAATTLQVFIYGYSLANLVCLLTALLMFAQVLDDNARKLIKQEIYINKQNDELTEMRTKIALSQIKPRFICNILSSTYELCDEDVSRAKEVIVHLSNYLQQSISSISTDKLISFEKELAHTAVYLELEKTRYPDRFDVEYDTQVTGFELPPLTVQPLVENAMTHGILKLPDDKRGKIRISTTTGNGYVKVEVSDNGVGFDMTDKNSVLNDERIGIRNVHDRLAIMEDAELHVKSKVGEGTTVDIIIPKR